jgi:hypothetical protein
MVSPSRRRTIASAAYLDAGYDAAGLAVGHLQHRRQAQAERQLVQAVLAHEMGAHTRQVAFVGAGVAFVQQARNGQAQHGVAEELEPFVVVGTVAAVREGLRQQLGPLEAVAEAALQVVQESTHRRRRGMRGAVNATCPGI